MYPWAWAQQRLRGRPVLTECVCACVRATSVASMHMYGSQEYLDATHQLAILLEWSAAHTARSVSSQPGGSGSRRVRSQVNADGPESHGSQRTLSGMEVERAASVTSSSMLDGMSNVSTDRGGDRLRPSAFPMSPGMDTYATPRSSSTHQRSRVVEEAAALRRHGLYV